MRYPFEKSPYAGRWWRCGLCGAYVEKRARGRHLKRACPTRRAMEEGLITFKNGRIIGLSGRTP